MGFLDRIGNALTGVAGAVATPVDLAIDLAQAPFTDNEHSGFFADLYGITRANLTEGVGDLFSPDSGIGAAIGGLPEGFRTPARSVIEPVNSALEYAYREGIGEPVSTAVTVSSMISDPGGGFFGGDIGGLFDSDTWSEAYRIAQHRSPGQAIALAFLTGDVLDEDEVDKAQQSEWYEYISAMSDLTLRLKMDPFVLGAKSNVVLFGGKAGASPRGAQKFLNNAGRPEGLIASKQITVLGKKVLTPGYGRGGKAMNTQRALKAARANGSLRTLAQNMEGLSAAELRNVFFARTPGGRIMSDVLSRAPSVEDKMLLMEAFTGQLDRLPVLAAKNPELASMVDNVMSGARHELVDRLSNGTGIAEDSWGWMATRDAMELQFDPAVISRETKRAMELMDDVRILREQAPLRYLPAYGAGTRARVAITGSKIYQESPMAWPVKAVFEMMPHRHVRLADENVDIHLNRFLHRASRDFSPDEILDYRNRALAMRNQSHLGSLFDEVVEETIRRQGARSGISVDEIESLVQGAKKKQAQTQDRVRRSRQEGQFAGETGVLKFRDEDGALTIRDPGLATDVPRTSSQLDEVYFLPDITKMNTITRRVARITKRLDGDPRNAKLAKIKYGQTFPQRATQMTDLYLDIWKPMTLLRGGWLTRVALDEQLRTLARFGVAAPLRHLSESAKRARRRRKDPLDPVDQIEIPTNLDDPVYVEGVFGPGRDADQANVYNALSSVDADTADFLRGNRATHQELSNDTAWQSHGPGHRDWIPEDAPIEGRTLGQLLDENPSLAEYKHWYERVWTQYASDELVHVILREGEEGAMRWARSVRSASYRRNHPSKSRDIESLDEWIQALAGDLDSYFPTPELTQMMLERRVSFETLWKAAKPDGSTVSNRTALDSLPTIHGQALLQGIDAAKTDTLIRRATNKLFQVLGAKPSNSWARHPMMRDLYAGDIARRIQIERQWFRPTASNKVNMAWDRGVIDIDDVMGSVKWADHKNAQHQMSLLDEAMEQAHTPGMHDTQADLGAVNAKLNEIGAPLETAVFTATGRGTNKLRQGAIERGRATIKKHYEELNSRQIGKDLQRRRPDNVSLEEYAGRYMRDLVRLGDDPRIAKKLAQMPDPPNYATFDDYARSPEFFSMTKQWETSARDFALSETKWYMYELAETSRFGEMMRFLSPFYTASQEVFTRWAQLARENPAFFRQMHLAMYAPERMGIVTDEAGNVIDEHGKIQETIGVKAYNDWYGKQTPERQAEMTHPDDYIDISPYSIGDEMEGNERIISFQLPDVFRNTPVINKLTGGGQVEFNKEAASVMPEFLTAGQADANLLEVFNIGFGPPVQIIANELVLEDPSLEGTLEFILPFGASGNIVDRLLPTTINRSLDVVDGERRVNQNRTLAIFAEELIAFEDGDRPEWIEANMDANEVAEAAMERARTRSSAVSNVRLASHLVSFLPAQPSWNGPYAMYVDAFRAREEWDRALTDEEKQVLRQSGEYMDPDRWFIETYGDEFWPLIQQVTRATAGVPPTVEGMEAYGEFEELITEFPEFGSLIIGEAGAGEFNRAVYENQLTDGGDSGRERIETEEHLRSPQINAGWAEYSATMDAIENRRVMWSIPNLRIESGEKGRMAQVLRAIREAKVVELTRRYPAWAEEYAQTDRLAAAKKITGLARLSDVDQLQGRPDMAPLQVYFNLRRTTIGELDRRQRAGGSRSLNAVANLDVAQGWATLVAQLVERNPAFAELFYRYLERDDLDGLDATQIAYLETVTAGSPY